MTLMWILGSLNGKCGGSEWNSGENVGFIFKTKTLFLFGHTCGMQKVLGQGLNLRYSSNWSHSSDMPDP